ncbi:hypothetical protein TNCV_3062221 [Trichonephila clavipes]|nr:hypothetical protein TNCV_3062221 [Trichonephila clavipes]
MGDFMYTENVDMRYMNGRAKGNGSAALQIECIKRSFQINECLITEFFSDYMVNFVKNVPSKSSGRCW